MVDGVLTEGRTIRYGSRKYGYKVFKGIFLFLFVFFFIIIIIIIFIIILNHCVELHWHLTFHKFDIENLEN